MNKISELIKATKHLLVFLEANNKDDKEDEEELKEVVQETLEKIEEIETPEEKIVEVEDIFEEPKKEPIDEVKLDFLKDNPIVGEKPLKPTKDMNYAELRAYYKKIKEEGNN